MTKQIARQTSTGHVVRNTDSRLVRVLCAIVQWYEHLEGLQAGLETSCCGVLGLTSRCLQRRFPILGRIQSDRKILRIQVKLCVYVGGKGPYKVGRPYDGNAPRQYTVKHAFRRRRISVRGWTKCGPLHGQGMLQGHLVLFFSHCFNTRDDSEQS